MDEEFNRRPVWLLTLQLGLPAMLAQFFNILYSIVDRIYLGRMNEAKSSPWQASASVRRHSPRSRALPRSSESAALRL